MFKRICLFCALSCVTILVHGCPFITTPDPASLQEVASALMENMSNLDTDDDGSLSFAEAQAGHEDMTQGYMDQVDTNDDNRLSVAELRAVGGSGGEGEGEGEYPTETFVLPGEIPLSMVDIPAGTFMMGSMVESEEQPVHQVTISSDFQLGQTEVTKAQWEAMMGTTPWLGRPFTLDTSDSPAVFVSWNDAQAFIGALNNHTGETFRLPTEAEWEYACRAGTPTAYNFGQDSADLSEHAWWYANGYGVGEGYAHGVGQKLPNDFGLYDMHGNVWEWCEDWYSENYYSSSPASDPTGPDSGTRRVLRGGGWASDEFGCRSANRRNENPNGTYFIDGFRVARTP